MLEEAYNRAKEILRKNKDKLDMLTEALLKQETLNRAEFVALMDEGKMPDGSDTDKPRQLDQILADRKAEEAAERKAEEAATETVRPDGTEDPVPPDYYQPPAEEDKTEYLND